MLRAGGPPAPFGPADGQPPPPQNGQMERSPFTPPPGPPKPGPLPPHMADGALPPPPHHPPQQQQPQQQPDDHQQMTRSSSAPRRPPPDRQMFYPEGGPPYGWRPRPMMRPEREEPPYPHVMHRDDWEDGGFRPPYQPPPFGEGFRPPPGPWEGPGGPGGSEGFGQFPPPQQREEEGREGEEFMMRGEEEEQPGPGVPISYYPRRPPPQEGRWPRPLPPPRVPGPTPIDRPWRPGPGRWDREDEGPPPPPPPPMSDRGGHWGGAHQTRSTVAPRDPRTSCILHTTRWTILRPGGPWTTGRASSHRHPLTCLEAGGEVGLVGHRCRRLAS